MSMVGTLLKKLDIDCQAEFVLAGTLFSKSAVVAEWLRRLTRNQIPSGSVGSNPTDCETLFGAVLRNLRMYNTLRGVPRVKDWVNTS